jgi:hypothetical protein
MDQLVRNALHRLDSLGPQGWALVLGAMILVGIVFLRGFGSRSQY